MPPSDGKTSEKFAGSGWKPDGIDTMLLLLCGGMFAMLAGMTLSALFRFAGSH
jgi:hypothetical protein